MRRKIDVAAMALMQSKYVTTNTESSEQLPLPKAKANSLSSLKLFGKCVQDGTPTPDAPVPIVCNNGELKARHQSGLPMEYQKVEYLSSNGSQYINTGIPVSDDLMFGYRAATRRDNIISISQYNAGLRYGLIVWQSGLKINFRYRSNGSDFTALTEFDYRVNRVFDFIYNDNNGFYINGVLAYTKTNTIDTFGVLATGLYDVVYGLWAKSNSDNSLKFNGIPCRRTYDNALGMYDTVSGQFFTNAGSDAFTAGPDVEDLEVYADGTVEQIQVTPSNDTANAEMLLGADEYADEQEVLSGNVTRRLGVVVLDGTENWEFDSSVNRFMWRNALSDQNTDIIWALCTHFELGYFKDDNSVHIYPGSGTIAFRYKTLNGDVDAFKAFLRSQLSTQPVVLLYYLEEPTTEAVTPQPLTLQRGNNVATIVQASLDGLELEATYKARRT